MNNEINVRRLCTGVYDERDNDKGAISRFLSDTSANASGSILYFYEHLEGTMNMKQDRRLNNGLLMHVNNLIMNDPDTVKVKSKQTVFCSTQLCKRHSGKFE